MLVYIRYFLLLACLHVMLLPAVAAMEQRKCGMDRDYWLYTPETVAADRTYWLVVGVHGAKGKGAGAAGLADWVNKYDNVIVVGPSFPIDGPFYQVLGGNADRQLLDIHKDLGKEFQLHDKMFIYGFSGGAQFAHRFTLKHPDHVIGVSAHSGGTWESRPNFRSSEVIWTISCGLKDTNHSAGAPLTRIEYFRNFCQAMLRKSFTVKPFVTNAGHRRTAEVRAATEECFRVATSGMFDFQRSATAEMASMEREQYIRNTNAELKTVEFDDGAKVHEVEVNEDGWMLGEKALRAMENIRRNNLQLNR